MSGPRNPASSSGSIVDGMGPISLSTLSTISPAGTPSVLRGLACVLGNTLGFEHPDNNSRRHFRPSGHPATYLARAFQRRQVPAYMSAVSRKSTPMSFALAVIGAVTPHKEAPALGIEGTLGRKP